MATRPFWKSVIIFCGSIGLSGFGQSLQFTELKYGESGVALEWSASNSPSGFVLQYKDALEDGIWRIPLELYPFPFSDTKWVYTNAPQTSRFYRLEEMAIAERGKVISATNAGTLSKLEIQFLFSLGEIPITPNYAVQLFRIAYETVTPSGHPTVASGALCLPVNASGPLPLLSYQHSALVVKTDVPSSLDPFTEVTVGIGAATSGYAAVVPDFLGLGSSPGLHPFHHARSEATSAVDMLRAARTVCSTNNVTLTNRLFLCGYSQGGHATLALLRELEWFHTNEFTVVACAPMGGVYDLSGTSLTNILAGGPQPNPYRFIYFLAAYLDVYRPAESLADMLALPYSTNLPPLLDGTHSGEQINAAMPADPLQILKPEILAEFRFEPRHWFRLALQDNDVFRWLPKAPLRFFHCAGDADVLPENARVAVEYIRSLGRTDVILEDPLPSASHVDCALPSMLAALEWFDQYW